MTRPYARWRLSAALLLACVALLGVSGVLAADDPPRATGARPIVYVAPIHGLIDLGLAPFVERVLEEATAAGAAAVILEVNTFGGRVDAAVLIRDTVLRARCSASPRAAILTVLVAVTLSGAGDHGDPVAGAAALWPGAAGERPHRCRVPRQDVAPVRLGA